jgi:hypothetical protein
MIPGLVSLDEETDRVVVVVECRREWKGGGRTACGHSTTSPFPSPEITWRHLTSSRFSCISPTCPILDIKTSWSRCDFPKQDVHHCGVLAPLILLRILTYDEEDIVGGRRGVFCHGSRFGTIRCSNNRSSSQAQPQKKSPPVSLIVRLFLPSEPVPGLIRGLFFIPSLHTTIPISISLRT